MEQSKRIQIYISKEIGSVSGLLILPTDAKALMLLAGGKSFGGRMTSLLAADGRLKELKGIVYYGFPLHAPGKPGIARAEHLKNIKVPQLFIQGTRDALAKLDLMKDVCDEIEKSQLLIIEGGDHSFKTLKRSGINQEETMEKLAIETAKFIDKLSLQSFK